MRRRRVYIIGIDGGTWKLLDRFCQEGILPNVTWAREHGAWGELLSTRHPITPAAWTSMFTGLSPAKHGIFDFRRRKPGTLDVQLVRGGDRDGIPLWRLAAQNGYRVGVFNVPMTYPAEQVPGFFVSGMDTPRQPSVDFVYPSALDQWFVQILGGRPYRVDVGQGGEDEHEYAEEVVDLQKDHVRVFQALLDRYDPEFCVAVFVGTDRLQHAFWKYWDREDGIGPVDEKAVPFWEMLKQSYLLVDEVVGELRRRVEAGGAVLVLVSDHGFGPLYRDVYLNQWLVERGWLSLRPAGEEEKFWERVDWERTRVYSFGYFGNLFLNLRGREPMGIVEMGREARELTKALVHELETWRDEDGEPIVDTIIAPMEIYSGPYLAWGPDLFVVMRNYAYMTRDQFDIPRGVVMSTPMAYHPCPLKHSGNHRMEGIFVMVGEGVETGHVEGMSVLDIMPTVLNAMGLAIPSGLDGEVLKQVFTTKWQRRHPIRYAKRSYTLRAPTLHSLTVEVEEMRQKLLRLGQRLVEQEARIAELERLIDSSHN